MNDGYFLIFHIIVQNPNETINTTSFCNKLNDHTPPKNSNCWKHTQRDIYHQKGCDHKSCQNAVCKCDPYCCEVSWDSKCRGGEDCSAALLCCEYDFIAYNKTFRNNDFITSNGFEGSEDIYLTKIMEEHDNIFETVYEEITEDTPIEIDCSGKSIPTSTIHNTPTNPNQNINTQKTNQDANEQKPNPPSTRT